MPTRSSRLLSACARAAAIGGLFATVAASQIPPDFVVVSRFQGNNTTSAPGGLTVMHPTLAAPVEITGLPPELVGTSTGTDVEGCAAVLVDPRTGNLIVGEHCLPGTTYPGSTSDIHVLTLSGFNVVADDAYQVGVPLGSGYVDQMAWLGDDVVFSCRGGVNAMASGVMAGHLIGILRPYLGPPGTPGTITPVPLTYNPPGGMNAIAVDEPQGVAYFGKFRTVSSTPLTEIYSVPVPGNGAPVAPQLVATINNFTVLNMHCDGDGTIVVGGNGSAGTLQRVDPSVSPATVTAIPSGYPNANGLTLDNDTGALVLAVSSSGYVYRQEPGAPATLLGNVSGVASGAAIRQSMQTYGEPSPGANRYDWVLTPNPGGAPQVGNAGFGITIASFPALALGVCALSLGEQSPPLPALGVSVLVDPAFLGATSLLVPGPQQTVSLPIPNNPNLGGMEIFAQTLHVEAAGFAASRGLRVTLLP